MDIETIFSLSNLFVMPFWALMILAPYWSWTKKIIGSAWIAAPVALIYLILIAPQVGGLLLELSNPTAAGVAQALSTPEGATLGWAHFLAFDLLVGRWIYLENQEKTNLSAWLMAPILFFTFMLGPIGFLLYLLARSVKTGRLN